MPEERPVLSMFHPPAPSSDGSSKSISRMSSLASNALNRPSSLGSNALSRPSTAEVIDSYPQSPKILKYGTAGFREKVDLSFHSVFIRMGMLACLRSMSMMSSSTTSVSAAASASASASAHSQAVGIMITASHNPEPDNGVKLIDVDGGMLSQSWEPYAEQLVNACGSVALGECLDSIVSQVLPDKYTDTGTDTDTGTGTGTGYGIGVGIGVVFIGRDTRPHSAELSELVELGVLAMGGVVKDIGEVTTPMLHWTVAHVNENVNIDNNTSTSMKAMLNTSSEELLKRYYTTIAGGYTRLCASADSTSTKIDQVVVDLSYGVGTMAAHGMLSTLSSTSASTGTGVGEQLLQIDCRNLSGAGPVNAGCGAEHVQKGQIPPCGVSPTQDIDKILVSFDGDADRIVFHTYLSTPTSNVNTPTPATSIQTVENTVHSSASWVLIDGDKIACLIAVTLMQEMQHANLHNRFTLGCVQTAYANGASTQYLHDHAVPVCIAKTGVKFVHHAALKYDCGVYFEANGHGTVLFSKEFLTALQQGPDSATTSSAADKSIISSTHNRQILAFQRLRDISHCINSYVGDAISDMLGALACLRIQDMSLQDWINIYTDYPSKQLKVPAKNKNLIICSGKYT